MATVENTQIFLICKKDEDVTEFVEADARIVPLRLIPETQFGAGEAFRLLDVSAIPASIAYVGFLTTDFLRKSGNTLANVQHPGDANTLVAFQAGGLCWDRYTYTTMAVNGFPSFATLWAWLLKEMDMNPFATPYYRRHIYEHCWLADRATALEFLPFVRRAASVMDKAPPAIQMILYNKNFENILANHQTYHTVLLERCIMLFCDIKKIRVV
jgi:hypothetical protein